ncbi:hypothetical protein C8R46DRAFT_574048 [Mycena filopes]|nr:hypothetical protein C8R46DRAFT_574048 [Mycena filopes]
MIHDRRCWLPRAKSFQTHIRIRLLSYSISQQFRESRQALAYLYNHDQPLPISAAVDPTCRIFIQSSMSSPSVALRSLHPPSLSTFKPCPPPVAMEQDRYPAFYGEPSLPAPSPLHMFKNARDFGITGSHFTSVQGNLNIGPMLALPAIRDIFGLLENEPPGRIASITPRVPKNNPPLPAVVHSAGDSYCRQMLRQGRGFPMYVPGPQKNLPVEYRREGIAIGDVGRVTPEGGFDFFFNIYRPANDPVNVKVPEGFVPLTPYDPIDVTLYDFDSGDYVSTPSIYDVNGGFSQSTPGGKFLFNCRGPNGAVLALPHGARLEKLENLDRMRQYAAKHAESWYKYVNEVRGRELVNGSLCLITGCEKSLSWGIASFQDISLHTDFPLSFTPTAGEDDGYKYRWQGGCGRHKQADAPLVDGTPLNQTTFIHAFTISLGEGLWGKLFGKVEVSQLADSWPDTVGRGFVPFGSQASRSSRSPGLFGIGGWKGCQYSAATFQQLSISETAPISRIFHPAQIIHKHILREVPDATVVITHDDEWRDMFEDVEDNDLEMTGSRYRFDIMEEHGQSIIFDRFFHLT